MRFCSECGKQLPARNGSLRRVLLAAVIASCVVAGFLAGRLSGPRERFHFIGEPISPEGAPPVERLAAVASGMISSPRPQAAYERGDRKPAAESICGALTKSGRPCQRRVRGGGRCWQHRAKPTK